MLDEVGVANPKILLGMILPDGFALGLTGATASFSLISPRNCHNLQASTLAAPRTRDLDIGRS